MNSSVARKMFLTIFLGPNIGADTDKNFKPSIESWCGKDTIFALQMILEKERSTRNISAK